MFTAIIMAQLLAFLAEDGWRKTNFGMAQARRNKSDSLAFQLTRLSQACAN